MERRRTKSRSDARPLTPPVAAETPLVEAFSNTVVEKREPKPALLRQKTGMFLEQIRPALRTFYWTIAVRGVSDISTADQTFQAQLFVEYYITLTSEEMEDLQEHCKTKGCITWVPRNRPRFTFMNEKEVLNSESKETQFYELKTGEIMCMLKDSVQVLFNEAFELENFPFDVQDLTMTFGDFAGDLRWSAHPMTTQTWYDIVKDGEDNDKSYIFMTRRYILDTEWDWIDIAVDFDFETWDGVTESTTYVAFKVQRQWVYYFWRVYFVLGILSLLAIFPLRLEADDRPDQLAFISTILLTAFVYQVVLSQLLPKLPYLTILDQYVLFTLIFCFIVALQIMFPNFYGEEWEDHVDYDNWTNGCMYFDLALWIFVQLYHVYLGWSSLKSERKKCLVGPLHEFRESDSHCYWIMDIPNREAVKNTCFLTERTTLRDEYAAKGSDDENAGSAGGDAKVDDAKEAIEMEKMKESAT